MNKLSNLLIASALILPFGCTGGDDDDGGDDVATTTATGSGSGDGSGDDGSGDDGSGDDGSGDDGVDDGVDSSGDDGPSGGDICLPTCAADADCTIMGMDLGYTCSTNTSLCFQACADDAGCQAMLSGWTAQPCTSNDECFVGPCVDYAGDGNGGCGTDATMNDCATFMQEAVDVTDVDGNTVSVCANTSATCGDLNGDMTCIIESDDPPPEFTCDDLMCADPLTCDDAAPSCNCASADDCDAAGITNSFDGGTVECRSL